MAKIGSLSDGNDDGNENGKKAIVLKDLLSWRWGTGNPPVHKTSHFNLITLI